jgi:hypothetical protein
MMVEATKNDQHKNYECTYHDEHIVNIAFLILQVIGNSLNGIDDQFHFSTSAYCTYPG